LRPMREGTIFVRATVVKPGRRVIQAECAMQGDDGKLVATATASFFVVED
jgi:acyl-coenzyme A thioesterase PaaI-like protein